MILRPLVRNWHFQGTNAASSALASEPEIARAALRDSADVATDLGDRLAEMAKRQGPYGLIQALAQGHTYDLSDGTTRALMNHQYRSREQEALDDQKRVGANPNETAKTAKDFEQSMRHLNELLGAIETKVTDHLAKSLQPLIAQLTKFAEDHGSDLADIINDIGDAIIAFAKAVTEKLETLDWKKITANVHALTGGFTAMLAKLGGDAGLIALLGLMVTHLKGLGGLGLPGWLKAILGISAATDLAIPNSAKPGMVKRWDDSAGGLPGDLGNSDMDEADKRAGASRKGFGRRGFLQRDGRGDDISITDDSITTEGKALLNTLASGEAHGYNVINGGSTFSDYSKHPYAGMSTNRGGRARPVATSSFRARGHRSRPRRVSRTSRP